MDTLLSVQQLLLCLVVSGIRGREVSFEKRNLWMLSVSRLADTLSRDVDKNRNVAK